MRRAGALVLVVVAAHGSTVRGQQQHATPLSVLDVPYISQSEALCGGAAAAMVLRFWGERDVDAGAFAGLVDPAANGIRTDALIADLQRRGWDATGIAGGDDRLSDELAQGRPVIALIEDRPAVYHYVVVVARHANGIVFHDPARVPYRVMALDEFARRWQAAGRWMAVITPRDAAPAAATTLTVTPPSTTCDQLVGEGVKAARDNQLAAAERALTAGLSCPGAARELAGVRLLQKRWDDVEALASAAVEQDAGDGYAWKLLGTARFIEDDPLGALRAWNRAMEPRLDLVQIDGLRHTRHRVVERLLDVKVGEVLTAGDFTRARRRLGELPSAATVRLTYQPAAGGRAELRGAVVERPLLPTSPLSLVAIGVSAAAAREVSVASGSVTGGGEQNAAAWRFWPHRERIALGVRAPPPWGGTWAIEGYDERQGFTGGMFEERERSGALLSQSDWITDHVRWTLGVGMDQWRGGGTLATVAGAARLVSRGDRWDVRADARTWMRGSPFTVGSVAARLQSSVEQRGLVWIVAGAIDAVSARTPGDLWAAGDTGAARTTLLRAHPVLSNGRLRISRIGRLVQTATVEGQRWWRVAGPIRAAAAAFVDVGRTSARPAGAPLRDVDAGIGGRFAAPGMPGTLSINLATGSDGATALSLVYVVE
jgi:predicted double-glycine peptidase